MKENDIPVLFEISSIVELIGVTQLSKINDFCIISFEHENQLDFNVLNHYRQFYYELVIDITDTCSFIIEGEKILPQKNHITLVKPLQLQSVSDYQSQNTNVSPRGFIMYFTSDFLKSEIYRLPIFDRKKVSSFTFTKAEMEYFEILADFIYTEYKNYKDDANRLLIQNFLENIILKIQQKDVNEIYINYLSSSKRLYLEFINAVHIHYLTFTTVKEYANHLNVTSNHLSDTVKRECGINALSIITKVRLEHSKVLLLQSNKTINEISDDLNFNDSNNFSSFFKKNMNISPKKFRENKR